MRKIFLSVIWMYIGILASFSQNVPDSAYKKRKLTFEEANLVSSYYKQDGNNASVTGGVGSEKLTDLSNTIDVRFSRHDIKGRKHIFSGEFGIDHYTSASSDKVDPSTISSASSADSRFYTSLGWNMENDTKRKSFGGGISFSSEYDYFSAGANLNFSHKTKNRNGELIVKALAFFDKLSLIYPIEIRPENGGIPPADKGSNRNTYSGSLAWSQILNKRMQVMLTAELVKQEGYLGLPFHRVYFKDNSVHVENLPTTRLKIPLGLRGSYFMSDRFLLRAWYRYFQDDWGIQSNAGQLEIVTKLTPFISVTPFYRYYQQTAADYFSAYQQHSVADIYYTSNYDLSEFNSNFFGAGFRIAPPAGIFKLQHFSALELRYGHYKKTTGMNADIFSMNITVK